MHKTWLLKFCPECNHGYLAVAAQTRRCPRCAAEHTRRLAAQRQIENVGRWPKRENKERKRNRRRAWRAENLERERNRERIRAARMRQRDPERLHANKMRYLERKRSLETVEQVERKLMEQATRQAVAEIKRSRKIAELQEFAFARRAEWQTERLAPKRCPGCGETFTPLKPTKRPQIFCNPRCRRRLGDQQRKLAKRLIAELQTELFERAVQNV
jgi:hypothetical protein